MVPADLLGQLLAFGLGRRWADLGVVSVSLGVVAANWRLFALAAMIKAFQARLAEQRGETVAEVTSAKELNDTQVQAITDALRAATGTNVAIDAKVDPNVLGGLVVKVGSRMVDSSLSTKLSHLRTSMIGAG